MFFSHSCSVNFIAFFEFEFYSWFTFPEKIHLYTLFYCLINNVRHLEIKLKNTLKTPNYCPLPPRQHTVGSINVQLPYKKSASASLLKKQFPKLQKAVKVITQGEEGDGLLGGTRPVNASLLSADFYQRTFAGGLFVSQITADLILRV